MRLLIVNWSGLNTGDDVMLEIVAGQARRLWPGVELGVVGHHVSENIAQRLQLRVFGSVFEVERGLRGWSGMVAAVRWSDAVLVGGGDIMRERIASLLPFALAAAFGRPVAGVSLGVVGRTGSNFWARSYALAISASQLWYVRDQASLALLQPGRHAPGKFRIAPDVAFSSHQQVHLPPVAVPAGALRVCVNLRELSDTAYLGVMSDSMTMQVTRIRDALLGGGLPPLADVVLVPMVDGSAVDITADQRDSDGHILQALAAALRAAGVADVKVIEQRPSGFAELSRWLDHADLVIGARYHFLIAALATNASVWSVSYAEKVTQLRLAIPGMRELGDQALSLSSPDEIAARHQKVGEMARQAQLALDDVLAGLAPGAGPALAQRLSGWQLLLLLGLEPATLGLRVLGGRLRRWLHGSVATAGKAGNQG